MNQTLLSIARQNPELINQLHLGKGQLAIYQFIRNNGITTSLDVAKHFDMAVNTASMNLKHICDKGYLVKKEGKSSSGGKLMSYEVYSLKPMESSLSYFEALGKKISLEVLAKKEQEKTLKMFIEDVAPSYIVNNEVMVFKLARDIEENL